MFVFRFLLTCLIGTGLWASAVAAESFAGRVSVVDGDTIHVGSIVVRLHGIDAVEHDQTCQTPDGRTWACGAWVVDQARARFEGREARCNAVDLDRYGRVVAKCAIAGADIGEMLVSEGLARAYRRYSMDYDLAEKGAQVRGAGLWSSLSQEPADFRRTTQSPEVPPPGADCVIKGNISVSGRIYHLPGQEHYADTRIDTGSGERWFCTEAEARTAGWRRARR